MQCLGSVQGITQCLGGIMAVDCTTCLSQAVGRLHSPCGAALTANVYLVQCSVRYWTKANYAQSSCCMDAMALVMPTMWLMKCIGKELLLTP